MSVQANDFRAVFYQEYSQQFSKAALPIKEGAIVMYSQRPCASASKWPSCLCLSRPVILRGPAWKDWKFATDAGERGVNLDAFLKEAKVF